MESDPLKSRLDVISLLGTLKRSQMFQEEAQFHDLVEHTDDLSFTVNLLQDQIAELRGEAVNDPAAPILAEAEASVMQAKGMIESLKERISDTAKHALSAYQKGGKRSLISTVYSAHIPQSLSELQQTLQDTEQHLRGSAMKAEVISSELNMMKTHLWSIAKVMQGGNRQTSISGISVALLNMSRSCFDRLADSLVHMSRTTKELKDRIPDLDRSAPVRQSVREKINGQHFRRDSYGMERQPVENLEL